MLVVITQCEHGLDDLFKVLLFVRAKAPGVTSLCEHISFLKKSVSLEVKRKDEKWLKYTRKV